MFYLIYKITNIINGKYYIGAHTTLNKNDKYMGSGVYIKRAIRKYGKHNFTKEIIAECQSSSEMYELEKQLVTTVNTYNIMPGGKGGWEFVNTNKLSGTAKGVLTQTHLRQNQDWRKKWKEKHHTGIHAHLKTVNAEQFRARGIQANNTTYKRYGKYPFQGKTHTDETKAVISKKLSVIQKGTNNSQYGTMWITDGIKNKKILKSEIIPDNWYKGRIIKK